MIEGTTNGADLTMKTSIFIDRSTPNSWSAKGILFKIYSMLAIKKHLAIEYRPINLVVIIFVPRSDFYLTQYSNLVL